MKALIKQLVPPLILDVFRKQTAEPYESWADAARHSLRDYSDSDLVNLVYEKTKVYMRDPTGPRLGAGDLALIAVLGRLTQRGATFSVVDFGGACGAHYFLAKAVFPSVLFDWRVVETKAMVTVAKRLESHELHFFSDLAEADSPADLVHTSGTLQCVPDPIEVLARLAGIQSPAILVNRLGVSETTEPVITVHRHMMSANGKGPVPAGFVDKKSAYPFQLPSRAEVEEMILRTHEIVFVAEDPSGVFPVGAARLSGLSYFCKRK